MKLLAPALVVGFVVVGSTTTSGAADLAAQLKAGKIVSISVPASGVWPGRAMGVVEASPEQVYRILSDFATYDEFVPRIRTSRHLGGNKYELKAYFPWPVSHTKAKLEVRRGKRGSTYVIKWRMISGTLKKYEGVAWIQPWKGRSMVTYQMLAVPKVVAPNAVMTNGLRKAVNGMVAAIRKRVEATSRLAAAR